MLRAFRASLVSSFSLGEIILLHLYYVDSRCRSRYEKWRETGLNGKNQVQVEQQVGLQHVVELLRENVWSCVVLFMTIEE